MSKSGRRSSRSPSRRGRTPSPNRRRSRSPRKYRRSRSPGKGRRASPDYSRYKGQERQAKPPAWIDTDISEDDVREQAGGDAMEFRRLKRLKLNERGVRSLWENSPTPSPSPERKPRRQRAEMSNGQAGLPSDVQQPVAEMPDQAQARPSHLVQEEITAQGPDVAVLHMKAAQLFKEWLTVEKAAAAEAERRQKQQEADNVIVGPVMESTEKAAVDYGTHMRPGEGTAMAAYVQSGKRIPRRGEVGMSADQITSYEELGYVMSGSRHNRMNAIRIRKENQVYTAEEKAALAMFNMEENKRKEQKILADMQRLVQKTLGDTEEDDGDAEAEEAAAS